MLGIKGIGGHMYIGTRKILAVVAVLAMAGQAVAQTSQTPSTREDAKLGSVYVRCDGFPAHRSAAELAARIVLIMATAGKGSARP